MDSELFLGIPGVDIPYPKYVQDALDFIERETTPLKPDPERMYASGFVRGSLATAMGTAKQDPEEKFWKVRKAQKVAQQKKRPYQPPDRADTWPSW